MLSVEVEPPAGLVPGAVGDLRVLVRAPLLVQTMGHLRRDIRRGHSALGGGGDLTAVGAGPVDVATAGLVDGSQGSAGQGDEREDSLHFERWMRYVYEM